MSASEEQIGAVLVRGASVDGSIWNDVIEPLPSKGRDVLTATISLTSLSDAIRPTDRAPAPRPALVGTAIAAPAKAYSN